MMLLRDDILDVTGTLQLCACQTAGCEVAIHAVHHNYGNENCEAIVLVDVTNAFNCLNHQTATRNIQILCPLFAMLVINIYQEKIDLFHWR